jgi:RimJ/RimL family protein N-acetyltransferase
LPKINLRPVRADTDAQFLFDLLAERPIDANINHKEMPTYEQHCSFVASNPYACWYIIEAEDGRAGSCYLTHKNEIGVFVSREHQGRSIAAKAIKELIRRHKAPYYLANIAPHNDASLALFRRLGFRPKQIILELQT